MRQRSCLVFAALLFAGCGSGSGSSDLPATQDSGIDASKPDSAAPDATVDSSTKDTGGQHSDAPLDTSTVDAPENDAPVDTGTADSSADTAPLDAAKDAPPDAPAVTKTTIVMASDVAQDGRTHYAQNIAKRISAHKPTITAVILGGDNARYTPLSFGTQLQYYNKFYKPNNEADWGQFDYMVYPQLGNHEYGSLNPKGFFDYFAPRMAVIESLPTYHGSISDTSSGYYSFDINNWHFVSLNSNCANVGGGCKAGSPQEAWLKADLAAHAKMPIVAIFHHPRYSCGGSHASDTAVQPFWADLYDAGADFVFNGHNHFYQRWQPLNKASPEAAVDNAKGITEIIAGSYGVDTYDICSPADSRLAKQAGGDPGMGAFYLTIGSDGTYSFEYELESDGSIYDSGSGLSHHH